MLSNRFLPVDTCSGLGAEIVSPRSWSGHCCHLLVTAGRERETFRLIAFLLDCLNSRCFFLRKGRGCGERGSAVSWFPGGVGGCSLFWVPPDLSQPRGAGAGCFPTPGLGKGLGHCVLGIVTLPLSVCQLHSVHHRSPRRTACHPHTRKTTVRSVQKT